MKTVDVAYENSEKLWRIMGVAPVQKLAVARRVSVEPAGKHLERTDQFDVADIGQRVQWLQRPQPISELPEAKEIVSKVEAVQPAQLFASFR